MNIHTCIKESFSVIGKEGSTNDGPMFIQRLWENANSHFAEISHLARRDENGDLVGIWGAMSDFSHSYFPWEDNFSKGLYLAGVECEKEAEAPEGWTKWIIPGFEYLCAEANGSSVFSDMIRYLDDHDLLLAGAVHDFTCPKTGKNYMYFPIKRI